MKKFFIILTLTLFIAIGVGTPPLCNANTLKTPQLELITIQTAQGPVVFHVELADTLEKKSRGLMYRKFWGDVQGMLFDFRTTQNPVMWMKNTYLPLDILFIDNAGIVVGMIEDTVPLSLKNLSVSAPSVAVLEIASGAIQHHGIQAGNHVHFSWFKQPKP